MPSRQDYARSKFRREHGLAWCSQCKTNKPQSDFDPCPGRRPFGLASYCHDCDRLRKNELSQRSYWKKSPEERAAFCRRNNIRRFGITLERYEEMLAEQGGVCAICKQPESEVHPSSGKIQPLVVDHNKVTGQVRGLLCTKCNKGIGLLRHSREYLIAAANYLFEASIKTS